MTPPAKVSSWIAGVALALLAVGTTFAQEEPASDVPPALTAEPASIPLSDVALRAEELTGRLRRVDALLQPSYEVEAIESAIADATAVLTGLQSELDQVDPNRVSKRKLEDHRLAWMDFDSGLSEWMEELQDRWETLTHERDVLEQERALWALTLETASSEASPAEILELVGTQLDRIDVTVSRLGERIDAVGSELARVSQGREISARALDRLADVARELRMRVWNRDAPPLWQVGESASGSELRNAAGDARRYWYETLVAFVGARQGQFSFLLACFFAFLFGALAAGRASRSWPSDDRGLDDARFVVSRPVSTALAFTVLLMVFLLDNTVGPVQDIVLALALVPIVRLGVGLIPGPARVALKGGVVLLLGNRTWALAPDGTFLRRVLLLIVTALAAVAALALISRWRDDPETKQGGWWRFAWLLVGLAAIVLSVSLVASVAGWSHLAERFTDGVVESGFGVLAWVTMVAAVAALVPLAARTAPGAILPSLRRHEALFARMIVRVFSMVALIFWTRGALRRFQLLEPVRDNVAAALSATASVGGLEVSAGRVVAAILILFATWLVGKAVQFFLREEILPRLHLPGGADHSVVAVANYVIWASGLLLSAAAGGLSGTQLTVVFGALGVGIGFGLQNIVSNFVSGLILIFERPIKVGDSVQTTDHFGIVTGIGIRASTIRTFDGAEVVVPNSDLVSKEFVNWTRTDMTRRVEVLVHVALGSDPKIVLEILRATASAHPKTLDHPPPSALMTGFGESALDFRLLVWTRIDDFLGVSSDLHVTINDELKKAGIKIPFPQRDLHVHPTDAESEGAANIDERAMSRKG